MRNLKRMETREFEYVLRRAGEEVPINPLAPLPPLAFVGGGASGDGYGCRPKLAAILGFPKFVI